MRIRETLLGVASMFALAGVLSAQSTVYVDLNSTPPGTGTQANPFTSIQVAVDSAGGFGQDLILVLPGTYVESIDTFDKNLTIRSTDGPLVTTIHASDPSFALTSKPQFFGNNVRLEGFTVTGADQGAALRAPLQMQLSVTRCIVPARWSTASGGTATANPRAVSEAA